MRDHMKERQSAALPEERVCYACNKGACAACDGWDRTIVEGKTVVMRCACECRESTQRKPNQRIASSSPPRKNTA